MLSQIKGLHHVTSMAKDARENNDFFTHELGLRRGQRRPSTSMLPTSATSIMRMSSARRAR